MPFLITLRVPSLNAPEHVTSYNKELNVYNYIKKIILTIKKTFLLDLDPAFRDLLHTYQE